MSDKTLFSDLAARAVTGTVLAAFGLFAVWNGGLIFVLFLALAVAAMVWEAARLLEIDRAQLVLGVLGAICLYGAATLDHAFAFLLLFLPAIWAVVIRAGQGAAVSVPALVVIMWASFVAVSLRDTGGALWMLWLILLVVMTDIGGYFAGRLVGGAKFWPTISPKKTWSGVVAGWVGAALVGAVFMSFLDRGFGLVLISIVLSFASQMGDIAESYLKRRAGVKDSSNLLPGHGGVLDRFDGVIGALWVAGLISILTDGHFAPI